MATYKTVRGWEARERALRQQLTYAEVYFKEDAAKLEESKAYRDACEAKLHAHWRTRPATTRVKLATEGE